LTIKWRDARDHATQSKFTAEHYVDDDSSVTGNSLSAVITLTVIMVAAIKTLLIL